ncbi:hypothetical protein RSal33209_2480 [Renibacterium salmoninarum ATCC 33209]|uniref:Uncharacterized protein n=2 Tax=Renibacterium salmoninarum TaxID=1646 RepID=A9WS77_RENSM|nr:hypothetical protein RSal33209_2480 [Renibacterium salmoninarum ATCC 33209]
MFGGMMSQQNQPWDQQPYGTAQQVYAAPHPADTTLPPPASLLRWFSSTAAAGIVVALLWWCAAPGGAFYGKGADALTWLPRDLVLAGLTLVAGIITGALLIPQRHRNGAWLSAVVTILGCAVGAVIAWQLGTFAGVLWGPDTSSAAAESVAFSLRSLGVLALWPFACAMVFFVANLASLLRSPVGGKG